jgi:hypothetical protein
MISQNIILKHRGRGKNVEQLDQKKGRAGSDQNIEFSFVH